MLVAVIWPNVPAFVGMPAGLRLTVQLEMVVPGSAKFAVFVMLYASARNDSLYFSAILNSLKAEKSMALQLGP